MIGLPPTFGLISKFHLVLGAADAGRTALLVVFLISTMLNAAYFLPISYQAFFPKAGPVEGEDEKTPFAWSKVREAPWACVVPLTITALLALVLFFKPGLFLDLANLFVEGLKS